SDLEMEDTPVRVELDAGGRQVGISGECAPGFEPVLEAFGANFLERGELGASVCVYREGRKVVDLWGGHTDPARQEAWAAGTMVSMASVVKGMLAFALHM